MPSVRKATYTLELPEDGDVQTFMRKGRRWASFLRGGRKIAGPLTADRKSVLVESECYYVFYTDHQGRRKSIKGTTDLEATSRLARQVQEREERLKRGEPADNVAGQIDALSAGDLIDGYLRGLERKGASASHVKIVGYQLRRLERELDWLTARQVLHSDPREWLSRLLKTNTPSSHNHYVRVLRAFGRFVAREYQLDRVPFRDLDARNENLGVRRRRRTLDADQLEALIAATRDKPHARGDKLPPLTRSMLYRVAAGTGFRASECSHLTRECFRFDADVPYVSLPAELNKNRTSIPVPLSRMLVAAVREWIEGHAMVAKLFPGRWAAGRHGSAMLAKDLKHAGIERVTPEGQFDFHSLRGQFLTGLILAGVDPIRVQKIGRLSSVHLLAKHYAKLSLADLADAVNRQAGQGETK